jgi:hypothetical protein
LALLDAVKVTDAELLPVVTVSVTPAVVGTILAVLVILPAAVTFATIVTVTVLLVAKFCVPVHVTAFPLFVQLKTELLPPILSLSDTHVSPAGSVSVMVISVVVGPLFLPTIVKVTWSPIEGFELLTDFVIPKSAFAAHPETENIITIPKAVIHRKKSLFKFILSSLGFYL